MIGAIFKNTSQALYISYLMEIIPASAPGSTEVAIRNLMESTGNTWEGHRELLVNAQGMTSNEWRAQCAIVRSTAEKMLPKPEHDAILARYAQYDNRIGVLSKARGIEGIARYLEPLCNVKGDCLMELMANFYNFRTFNAIGDIKRPPALRDIAERYERSTKTLARAKQIIGLHTAQLEMQALRRLWNVAVFERIAEAA